MNGRSGAALSRREPGKCGDSFGRLKLAALRESKIYGCRVHALAILADLSVKKHGRALKSGRRGLKGSPQGLDMKSGLSVVKLIGTETCSCTISHLPLTFRRTSVTRTAIARK